MARPSTCCWTSWTSCLRKRCVGFYRICDEMETVQALYAPPVQALYRGRVCRRRITVFRQLPLDLWRLVLTYMRIEARVQRQLNMICSLRLLRVRHSPIGVVLENSRGVLTGEQCRVLARTLSFVRARVPLLSSNVMREAFRLALLWVMFPPRGTLLERTPAHALLEILSPTTP